MGGVAGVLGAGPGVGDVTALCRLVVVVRVGVSNDGGVPKTELVGGGEAWVLSGGGMVHASWSKPDRLAPIRLIDDTGAVIRLAPGNSWFELVPNSGSVTQLPAA